LLLGKFLNPTISSQQGGHRSQIRFDQAGNKLINRWTSEGEVTEFLPVQHMLQVAAVAADWWIVSAILTCEMGLKRIQGCTEQ